MNHLGNLILVIGIVLCNAAAWRISPTLGLALLGAELIVLGAGVLALARRAKK